MTFATYTLYPNKIVKDDIIQIIPHNITKDEISMSDGLTHLLNLATGMKCMESFNRLDVLQKGQIFYSKTSKRYIEHTPFKPNIHVLSPIVRSVLSTKTSSSILPVSISNMITKVLTSSPNNKRKIMNTTSTQAKKVAFYDKEVFNPNGTMCTVIESDSEAEEDDISINSTHTDAEMQVEGMEHGHDENEYDPNHPEYEYTNTSRH
jgi:hypothetical protein